MAALGVVMALSACGGSGDAKSPTPRVVAVAGPHGKLRVEIPPGRPPRHLVVRDLRKGSGPAVESLNDEIVVEYVGLYFSSGQPFYDSWEAGLSSNFILHETHPGWEIGLMGMRQGGLRQLITPPRLEYGTTTFVYVIEMVKVRHAAK